MPYLQTDYGLLGATFYLAFNQQELNKSILRLATGSNLTIPSDNPAGVAVSASLESRIRRLEAATDNATSVISYAQTTDGFLKTIQEQLTRMSELALQATNAGYGSSDRSNLNIEFTKLRSQIDAIVNDAAFNGSRVFIANTIFAGISPQPAMDSFITTTLGSSTSLGIASLSLSTTTASQTAVTSVSSALTLITSRRAEVNADISKFNFYIQNIGYEQVATESANSSIRDLDIAREATNMARLSIIVQAGTAVIAQANLMAEDVLTLLKTS